MGLKSFIIKKVLSRKLKGVPEEQIDDLVKKLEENPELANSLKELDKNKELKDLFEKIQKEIEEKTANGMNAEMAQMSVMMKYKNDFIKHQKDLQPLMSLMGGFGGGFGTK